MPKAHANDIDIYYEDTGKGYPLVLISGIGGNTMSWRTILNVLSRHFRVITFDNRGCGQSTSPEGSYLISQMANDLHDLLKFLKINTAHVLGHSMGGFIAQELALQHPEMVNKLILSCTADKMSNRNKQLFQNMYNLWKAGMSRELWFRELYCWVFSSKFFEDEAIIEFMIQFAAEYPFQQSLTGFKGQFEACVKCNTTERLCNILQETLVVAGKDDILITPDNSCVLNDNIPNSKMVILEGSGHTPQVEAKSKYTKAILDFLL